MFKKGYYGNKGLGLAEDRIKMRRMNLFITTNIANHIDVLRKKLDIQMSKYDNFLIVDDFDCQKRKWVIFVIYIICITGSKTPHAIKTQITNFPISLMKTQTLETVLSDFHKLRQRKFSNERFCSGFFSEI